jgi:hypothetical protein
VACVSTPLSVVALVGWLISPQFMQGDTERGTDLLFVLHIELLLVSLCAGVVAALAHGQAATARAFTAGYNAGLAVAEAAEDRAGVHLPTGQQPKPLRLVE